MMRTGLAVAAISLMFSFSPALAQYQSGQQTTPPVFKDAQQAQNTAAPPALPPNSQPGDNATGNLGTVETDDDPGGQTTITQEAPADTPEDPCAGSMDNIDAYTVCQDMIQKIERMKKGASQRNETYHPKPKEEKKDEAKKDGDKKDEAKKEDKDKKSEDKKDTDKDKDTAPDQDQKKEPEKKKDASSSEVEKKEE